jgi:hypothetical protein
MREIQGGHSSDAYMAGMVTKLGLFSLEALKIVF